MRTSHIGVPEYNLEEWLKATERKYQQNIKLAEKYLAKIDAGAETEFKEDELYRSIEASESKLAVMEELKKFIAEKTDVTQGTDHVAGNDFDRAFEFVLNEAWRQWDEFREEREDCQIEDYHHFVLDIKNHLEERLSAQDY